MPAVELGSFAGQAATFRELFSILRYVSNDFGRLVRVRFLKELDAKEWALKIIVHSIPEKSIHKVRGDDNGRGRIVQAYARGY